MPVALVGEILVQCSIAPWVLSLSKPELKSQLGIGHQYLGLPVIRAGDYAILVHYRVAWIPVAEPQ